MQFKQRLHVKRNVSLPRRECWTRLLWLLPLTSSLWSPLPGWRRGSTRAGEAPDAEMPTSPPHPPWLRPLRAPLGVGCLGAARARAPVPARAGLFPPFQLSPGAARGRSGVWWARSGGSCAFPPRQQRRERQRRRLESRCRVSHPGSGRDPAAAAAEM